MRCVELVAIGDKEAYLPTPLYAHIESRQFAAGMLGRRPVYNNNNNNQLQLDCHPVAVREASGWRSEVFEISLQNLKRPESLCSSD
jgi:hypothetical protein